MEDAGRLYFWTICDWCCNCYLFPAAEERTVKWDEVIFIATAEFRSTIMAPRPPFILLELLVAYLCIWAEIDWPVFWLEADFFGNCSIRCFFGEGETINALLDCLELGELTTFY